MDMCNKAYCAVPEFIAACEKAGIKPTSAQASKYRRGFGIAYTTQHGLALGSRSGFKERPGADLTPPSKRRAKIDPEKGLHKGPYKA